MTPVSSTAVLVRVVVPDVVVPDVDPSGVRALAAAWQAASDRLGECAWRLGGAAAAMAGSLGWCGPASAAFLSACGEQRAWYVNAWLALQQAAATCRAYAVEVDLALGLAGRASSTAGRLQTELAELVAAIRRVDLELAAAPTRGPGELALFTGHGAVEPEVRRLQAWADRLAAEASALRSQVDQSAAVVARADATIVAELDRIASMTCAARLATAAHSSAESAGPKEDGSLGSRFGGFFGALRDDVTGPLEMLGGLVGLGGNPVTHWSELGSALGHATTHPVELAAALADWEDVSRGNWGHWLGTIGPQALVSLPTAGGYAAVRAADALELVRRADAIAAELAGLADHAEIARVVAANGGYDASLLTRGGGLLAHEIAGGHTIAKHVGLSLDQLRDRLTVEGKFTASTFVDRASAERIITEILDAKNSEIMIWLGPNNLGKEKEFAVSMDLGRPVGISVKPGRPAVVLTKVRVRLVRDSSPLGFHIETAYPLR